MRFVVDIDDPVDPEALGIDQNEVAKAIQEWIELGINRDRTSDPATVKVRKVVANTDRDTPSVGGLRRYISEGELSNSNDEEDSPGHPPRSEVEPVVNMVATEWPPHNLIGSQLRRPFSASSTIMSDDPDMQEHIVLLDIDIPLWVRESKTPGHYHLAIWPKEPLLWSGYKRLLEALMDAGIIQVGYYKHSVARKQTFVRAWPTRTGFENDQPPPGWNGSVVDETE